MTTRDAPAIAAELYDSAERLADLAEVFASGEVNARTLKQADRLLVGAIRLVSELRRFQQAEAMP